MDLPVATTPYLWRSFHFSASLRVRFLFPLTGWCTEDGFLEVIVQASKWCQSLSRHLWAVILALSLPCSPPWCPLSLHLTLYKAHSSLWKRKGAPCLFPPTTQQQPAKVTVVWATEALQTPCRNGGVDILSWWLWASGVVVHLKGGLFFAFG